MKIPKPKVIEEPWKEHLAKETAKRQAKNKVAKATRKMQRKDK